MTDRDEDLRALALTEVDALLREEVERLRQRAEAAEAERDLLDTQVKTLRVMLTEARAQLDAEWNAAIMAASLFGVPDEVTISGAGGYGEIRQAIRALRRPAKTAGEGDDAAPRIVVPETLSAEQLADACLSYRHDYGLMIGDEREDIRREAAEWWRCFEKALNDPPKRLRASQEPRP